MLNLALSKGWKSWTNMIDARASARRAFAHFAGSNLVKAVSAWEEYAENERTMRGALRRLFSRQLSMCFESWQEAAEVASEQKRRMRGILAGFGGPKRKALNSWKGHCEDLMMMKRSLARLVMGAQARAVGTWVAYIEARAAQAKKMHDALSGKSGALRYGLGRWSEFVEELRLVRKALGGLRGGGLKKGLAAWVDFVEAREDAQALARKAVLRITPRGKAWNSWLSYLESLVAGRRALSHMVNAGLSKCWGAWGAYLDMLQEKRMCLAHLFNRDLSRAWRAWEQKMHEAELMAKSMTTLRNLEAKNVLVRWSRSAEEREEMLRKMRGTLYVLGDGHKTKKCLNSWKELMGRNQRAMLSVARLFGGQKRKALGLLVRLPCAELQGLQQDALRLQLGAAQVLHRVGEQLGLQRRRLQGPRVLEQRRAAQSLPQAGGRACGALRGEARHEHVPEPGPEQGVQQLARPHGAARGDARLAHGHGARGDQEVPQHLGGGGGAARRGARQVRGGGLHAAQPAAEEELQLDQGGGRGQRAAAARDGALEEPAAQQGALLPECERGADEEAQGAGVLLAARQAQRRAELVDREDVQAWLLCQAGGDGHHQPAAATRAEQLARLWRRFASLLKTFRSPAKRSGFDQWRSVTKTQRKGPKSPPKSPHQWRMINAMTWRECCSWLTRIGIPVSRSPPTLIRTLKEGFVRKISPAYYVRHKVRPAPFPRLARACALP